MSINGDLGRERGDLHTPPRPISVVPYSPEEQLNQENGINEDLLAGLVLDDRTLDTIRRIRISHNELFSAISRLTLEGQLQNLTSESIIEKILLLHHKIYNLLQKLEDGERKERRPPRQPRRQRRRRNSSNSPSSRNRSPIAPEDAVRDQLGQGDAHVQAGQNGDMQVPGGMVPENPGQIPAGQHLQGHRWGSPAGQHFQENVMGDPAGQHLQDHRWGGPAGQHFQENGMGDPAGQHLHDHRWGGPGGHQYNGRGAPGI